MVGQKKPSAKPLVLTNSQQVKALANPLRFRVFERLIDQARTGKQLAELLGTRPTNLYHHLRVLQRAGLIRKVATRKKRGTIEQYFQAVSDRIVVEDKLFKGRVNAGSAIRGQVLQVVLDELLEAERLAQGVTPRPPVMLKRLRIRTTPTKIENLVRALNRWLASCEQASQDTVETEYAIVVALYPTRVNASQSSNDQAAGN